MARTALQKIRRFFARNARTHTYRHIAALNLTQDELEAAFENLPPHDAYYLARKIMLASVDRMMVPTTNEGRAT